MGYDQQLADADQVMADTAAELGCKPDNEEILASIARLRSEKQYALDTLKAEIERLQDVKRRTLAIADERAIEAVKARAENERLRAVLQAVEHTVSVHGHMDADTELHERIVAALA